MPKRKRDDHDPCCFYRRQGSPTIYARDEMGRYRTFSVNAQGVVTAWPGGLLSLGPIYGRVNFANDVRFNGRTRSQAVLRQRFAMAAPADVLSTGWVDLPHAISYSRRQTNQGMNTAMANLTGLACSATRYAIWFDGLHPAVGVRADMPWEWCHLLAHSMGGADNETNIVAARKGNNSEQLAIESALQMYRHEGNAFSMKIKAVRLDGGHGRHLGNLIRYKIRCNSGGDAYVRFLDCLNAPNPSQIHYYDLLREVARWANHKLEYLSAQVYGNEVSKADRRAIRDYLKNA